MHTLLSLMTWLPLDIHVADGKKLNNIGAYGVFPNKQNVIMADRGYVDSELGMIGTAMTSRLSCDSKRS